MSSRFYGVVVAAALAAGCARQPTEPDDLVANLRSLAATASSTGNQVLADALGSAAGAISSGVSPSEVPMTIDGAPAMYQGLVVGSVQATSFGRLVFRTFIGWRGTPVPEDALLLQLAADEAPIGSDTPPDPDPRSLASALLAAGKSGQRWLGIQGSGRVAQLAVGSLCPWPVAAVAECRLGTFSVRMQGTFVPFPSGTGTRTATFGPVTVAGFVNGPMP